MVIVGYAIGPAILARRLAGVPSVGVMAIALGLTAIVYLPFALTQLPATVPSPKVLASIAILAVICTALAFIVFAALIKEIGPVRSTVITYINPAVAAVLGVSSSTRRSAWRWASASLLVIGARSWPPVRTRPVLAARSTHGCAQRGRRSAGRRA